jgi:predicted branched-subunit amino acid permease
MWTFQKVLLQANLPFQIYWTSGSKTGCLLYQLLSETLMGFENTAVFIVATANYKL